MYHAKRGCVMETNLSLNERSALVELGRRGAGGNFDQFAMSKLFAMGLVEVRPADRRLVLTDAGQGIFLKLAAIDTVKSVT